MQARNKTVNEIRGWIIDYLVATLGVTSSALQSDTCLLDLGIDSIEAECMTEALEGWLGTQVASTVLREQPTIAALAQHLAGEGRRSSPRALRGTVRPESTKGGAHPFETAVNPRLARLLGQLGLDKRFVRGQGCLLYDEQGRRYLDFVAAYGALPLGHNPPEIWSALEVARARGVPNFIQPSYLEAAGELAVRLLSLVPPGLHTVTFTNSGAEAVEAAIKMCRVAAGRQGILSTLGGFHGKTLGALSATANPHYHHGPGMPVAGFDAVPFGDAKALYEAFSRHPGYYAAFVLEPIQGEGGIVEPPPGYLVAVRELCDQAGVPMVLDEVQTGLGRTGAWFACDHEGVVPDAMTLAKALGGGLVPIGAVVAGEHLMTEEFGLKHSSTFAGGSLACVAGLAVLDHLAANDAALIRQVAERGARFKQGLERLAARFPHLVSEVRGRGLLLGLRFAVHQRTWPSSLLAIAAEDGGLAPLFAGYMLNVEGVRLAPTLNGTDVIRLEPPLTVTWSECKAVLAALERGLLAFARGDAGRVLHGICTGVDRSSSVVPSRRATRAAPRCRPEDGRFAFLLHPLRMRSYADFDPTLAALAPDELDAAVRCVHGLTSPAVVGQMRISSAVGSGAYGEFLLVGHTADELSAMPHARAVAKIREAVELARDRGAKIVGLGAFTSIVTQGGLAVRDAEVAVTSGNAYTVVAAHEAMKWALERRRVALASAGTSVAVIGAGGAIGRAISILLANDADRLILVGNPRRSVANVHERLLEVAAAACREVVAHASDLRRPRGDLAAEILRAPALPAPGASVSAFVGVAERLLERDLLLITRDATVAAREADALLTATSGTGELLRADDLRPGAVVCEVSRPHNLGPEIRKARPDVQVIEGGIIELPGRPDIGNFGLPTGHVYACMAETMLLALDARYAHSSLGGKLELAHVDTLRTLAERHGFGVSLPLRPTAVADRPPELAMDEHS